MTRDCSRVVAVRPSPSTPPGGLTQMFRDEPASTWPIAVSSLTPAAVLEHALDSMPDLPAGDPRGVLRDVSSRSDPDSVPPLMVRTASRPECKPGKTRWSARLDGKLYVSLKVSGATSAKDVLEWMAGQGRPVPAQRVYAVLRERTNAT